jgi:hypothetical protein
LRQFSPLRQLPEGIARTLVSTGLLLLLSACDGGGDKAGGPAPPTSVTVSGTANYEFVPPNASCNGLDFAATATRPIRGATVELINPSDSTVIATTTSSGNGRFSFGNIDFNLDVRLRVRAALKQNGASSWDVEVRDNYVAGGSDNGIFPPAGLSTRAMYVLDGSSFNTGTADVSRNLTATTGWDGNAYTEPRAAAPFALLDVTYTMMQFVRAADPGADFPPLDMFWSINNKVAAETDLTAGDLPTSSYWGSIDSLFILGDDTDDTDEFDDHIVAHEWSHYFEDTFSRSDSFGGRHFLGESLEARLAFGEGWASALGAMGLNDPLYCDTGVPGTREGGGYNAESSSFGVKGWFNEVSVTALIYDLWDTANEAGDSSSLGFRPIYNIMTGPQAATEAFTTLFSFATELRSSLNTQGQAGIDELLDRENVVSGVAMDIWAENETNSAGAAADVLPLYTDYIADGSILNLCVNNSLDGLSRDGNNVGEDRYLRITVPMTDEYDIVVATTTPTPVTADPDDRDQSDPDIYLHKGPLYLTPGLGGSAAENLEELTTPVLQQGETYIAFLEEWRFEDDEASVNYPTTICFDVSFSPTP